MGEESRLVSRIKAWSDPQHNALVLVGSREDASLLAREFNALDRPSEFFRTPLTPVDEIIFVIPVSDPTDDSVTQRLSALGFTVGGSSCIGAGPRPPTTFTGVEVYRGTPPAAILR
ncbi:MAG: hypothetical protein GC136_07860 [Alphaproteobacteria bacterium]|nr:hypothetical protein [Alphaproteobacteria bacterium]